MGASFSLGKALLCSLCCDKLETEDDVLHAESLTFDDTLKCEEAELLFSFLTVEYAHTLGAVVLPI